jgi:hypothetical protein
MKKLITFFIFSLIALVAFGQTDTVEVNEGLIEGVPAWLEAAIALVITLIPGGLLVKVNYRLGKFVALSKTLTDANV